MTQWKQSHFDTFYQYCEADLRQSCEVILVSGELTLTYYDEDSKTYLTYKGKETSPGHFELSNPDVRGSATLHRLAEEDVLVGEWHEGGDDGLWRVVLQS